jgi:hypothetical protein
VGLRSHSSTAKGKERVREREIETKLTAVQLATVSLIPHIQRLALSTLTRTVTTTRGERERKERGVFGLHPGFHPTPYVT